jgi:peptide chain release factor 1
VAPATRDAEGRVRVDGASVAHAAIASVAAFFWPPENRTSVGMLDKLKSVEDRYAELEQRLSDPAVIANNREYANLARERSQLNELVECAREYRRINDEIAQNRALIDSDPELRDLARAEIATLERRRAVLEARLKELMTPRDPNDERNVILEIRAGTGGEEASLFASELFRMYTRYAERHGFRVETLSLSSTGLGGIKEVIASITGRGAWSRFKFEGGVHRVQRVPATEASGRIHTSAVTVAVLPEADEVEVNINEEKDLRIDVMRASGPGGQSVNTTDSAVRITHLPTGIVIVCRDEKSQHKNKARALKILRARLLEKAQEEQNAKIAQTRRSMVGTGDRSERIRTYNFPQSRVTDHRINLTLHQLDQFLDGNIDPLIDELASHERANLISTG